MIHLKNTYLKTTIIDALTKH